MTNLNSTLTDKIHQKLAKKKTGQANAVASKFYLKKLKQKRPEYKMLL